MQTGRRGMVEIPHTHGQCACLRTRSTAHPPLAVALPAHVRHVPPPLPPPTTAPPPHTALRRGRSALPRLPRFQAPWLLHQPSPCFSLRAIRSSAAPAPLRHAPNIPWHAPGRHIAAHGVGRDRVSERGGQGGVSDRSAATADWLLEQLAHLVQHGSALQERRGLLPLAPHPETEQGWRGQLHGLFVKLVRLLTLVHFVLRSSQAAQALRLHHGDREAARVPDPQINQDQTVNRLGHQRAACTIKPGSGRTAVVGMAAAAMQGRGKLPVCQWLPSSMVAHQPRQRNGAGATSPKFDCKTQRRRLCKLSPAPSPGCCYLSAV